MASPPATPPFHPLPTAETHGSKWGRVKLFIGNLSIRWSLTLNVHACMLSHFRCVWLCQPYGLQPVRLLCPRDSPGKNTRVGGHALHQGIFLMQGSNPCLLCLPAGTGVFFATSATWEAPESSRHAHLILHIEQRLEKRVVWAEERHSRGCEKIACGPLRKESSESERGSTERKICEAFQALWSLSRKEQTPRCHRTLGSQQMELNWTS